MINAKLETPITYLPTVGPYRAALLKEEFGIATFGDLLEFLPHRYIDRSVIHKIGSINEQNVSYVQVRARVLNTTLAGVGRKQRFVVEVADDTGFAQMVWFNRVAWIQKHIQREREYIFFGKAAMFNGQLSITHPEFEIPANAQATLVGVQGVYSTTEKLTAAGLGPKAISQCVKLLWNEVDGYIPETLPDYLIQNLGLMSRRNALYQGHFPQNTELLNAAIFRLKFEELLALQLNMLQTKMRRQNQSSGYVFSTVGRFFTQFYENKLPFPLTGAQKRVIKEIRADMGSGHQMNRLLQGDVGSGKTIVALMCALIAIDNGFQTAIMAPTEILARQHFQSISELCEGMGLRIRILTGNTRKAEREETLGNLAQGRVELLIGTHALIEDPVSFQKLGFVVIDEQHRFGVQQRAKLWNKSVVAPHILVMTATPIPRTLAMTIYGDLDVSIIDELPPGRKQIKTYSVTESERLKVVGFMRKQIEKGRQIYVVFPLIKESEKMDYANLEQGAVALVEHFPHPQYTNVVVHGKMQGDIKEYGMRMFKEGMAQIMISTTVIEVGVNVPNASVMVIESAERFGLSQLHQLRGRVGRGADQSYCILVTGNKMSADSARRIEAMCGTTDGFKLAEMDMEIRGVGDLEGTRQSGQAIELNIANLSKDGAVVEFAMNEAKKIIAADENLDHPLNQRLKDLIQESRVAREAVDFSQIS